MINESENNLNFIQSKIFNPFHGGIALGAIYAMDDLDAYETSVLIFIGSKLVVHGDHHSWLKISKREIIAATKIKRSKVTQVIQTLLNKSYIYVESNFDEFNSQQENTYYLSDYLFTKYVSMAQSRQTVTTPAVLRTGGGHNTACYNTSVAIDPNGLRDEAEQIDIKEKEINNIDLKYCASEAEGEPLSLCQNCRNYEKISDSGLASPISAHDNENDFDDILSEPIKAKDQFASKIKKTADDHPEYITPRVTPSHRKMIQIFRITDPHVRKKSFVKDNDIYFMTDQILEKHGKDGHAIIDQLLNDMIEEGLCGKLPWSLKSVWIMVDIAINKIIEKNELKIDGPKEN